MEHSFNSDAEWFVKQIGSRKRMLPLFAHLAATFTKRVDEDLDKFIDQHAYEKVYENEELIEYAVPADYSGRHQLLTSSFNDSIIFTDLLPKMTLVSLVSIYDAYLARLVKTLFLVKPESLSLSNKQFTFAQLSEFETLDSAKEHVVDCEIESLLRDNHVKQFEWLEEKLGISLRKDLPVWKNFVELTERRNLLVHADGIVSKQYLTTCKNIKYPLDEALAVGDKLSVPQDYYTEACDCIAEIGIKLNQVMWRKLLPKDIEAADDSIVGVTYDLLLIREYSLAETLLRFATKHPIKNHSTEILLYLKVNLAISLKGQDKNTECCETLDSVDWSALADMFKLAAYVLKDEYDEAASIMTTIGSSGRPTKKEYKVWPLFRWFRKTSQFKDAYERVFGEQFKIIAQTDTDGEVDEKEEAAVEKKDDNDKP